MVNTVSAVVCNARIKTSFRLPRVLIILCQQLCLEYVDFDTYQKAGF